MLGLKSWWYSSHVYVQMLEMCWVSGDWDQHKRVNLLLLFTVYINVYQTLISIYIILL